MRIAFVAPYQGPGLVERRPIVRNLSLGSRAKIELIAELLQKNSHSVEILSQGEVIEPELRAYPAFREDEAFSSSIPIYYASAVPVKFVNGFWSSRSTLRLLKARHRKAPFDLVILYNLKPTQVSCANYAISKLGLPVILEYEDDQFRESEPTSRASFITSQFQLRAARKLLASLSGCIAGSPALPAQVPSDVPKLLLPGVVGAATQRPKASSENGRNWVVFSGTHSPPQGLEQLVKGWKLANLSDWQLHIAGHGEVTASLHRLAQNDPSIVFRGVLGRHENAQFLSEGKLTIVPYDISTTQGFSFKTLECLGAGMHVISTRLSALDGLESDLKAGITFMNDNAPETIAASLRSVIEERRYEVTVQQATMERYGPEAVSRSLNTLLQQVMIFSTARNGR